MVVVYAKMKANIFRFILEWVSMLHIFQMETDKRNLISEDFFFFLNKCPIN